MACFNRNNIGYKGEGYPLFLGPELGVIDTINVNYPQLEELYQVQVSQIWNEHEIDLTQDKMDMLTVPEETRDLMVKTLSWQTAADSIAASSIVESLGDYITNSELVNLATLWSFFEIIHARTYSHIIKQTFVNPNQMLEQLYADQEVLSRLVVIEKAFNNMKALPSDASDLTKRKAILMVLTALFGLEAIAFMSSFAVTFAITETGVFQGIGQLVKLICRDEVSHTMNSYEIFKILLASPEWDQAFEETKQNRQELLDELVVNEVVWTGDLFSEGRKVIGLNAELLKEYSLYMAKPIYDLFNLNYNFKEVKTNPLPYMDSYVNGTKVQAAAQEIQLTNYNVGSIADDNLNDLDLSNL